MWEKNRAKRTLAYQKYQLFNEAIFCYFVAKNLNHWKKVYWNYEVY